ncbi:MAG: 30S ribosomal protein S1 [Candidatus Neomarinimicrobiota bacterium]|nr:30S ribosomal protein S1 [Candidatus Neomarinimicrobiota bacterium]
MIEQELETPSVKEASEEISDEVSTKTVVSAEEMAPAVDYLSPELFQDINVYKKEDLDQEGVEQEIPAELQTMYLKTLSDIDEQALVTGRVIGMTDNDIILDIGFKSEGIIEQSEFPEDKLPKIGEQIEVFLETLEDKKGNMVLSKTKADFLKCWKKIRMTYENSEIITCKILRRIKGGMVVDIGEIEAFLPGSQIDIRPVRDFDLYLNKELEVRIVKFNEMRKNIVVSRKVLLEDELKEQREHLFDEINVGDIMEGQVKNVTDFGVFIDLGGVDGLLHITDISWGRVNHPSEVVALDEKLTVKVIDFDEEKRRISLGLKQLTTHPWENVNEKYPIGSVVKGKIVSMTNYGAFIEIESGVEGLIHISEISWTKHIKNPSEQYNMGDEIEAQVLTIDTEDRKISLGVKQLLPDPWDTIEEKYMIGTVQKGKVMNLTQFGAFVGFEEGVDGLIHVSDLSWTTVIRHPKEVLEKDQEVEVRILEVSRENRRISLGLKQVEENPWEEIIKHFEAGKKVQGTVIHVLDKGIILQMEHEVEGIVPFGRKSKKIRTKIMEEYKRGDELTTVVMEVKPSDKKIILILDELNDSADEKKDAVKEYMESQEAPASEKIEIPIQSDNTEADTE